ncbi:hypothetical protein KEM56_007241 [Ascosphaera pollenicola]|nr:hypothetical protein KEM56_007241 [Ascosphaera pollenicola]
MQQPETAPALPSLDTSLGQMFQDLSMSTPGPTRSTFEVPDPRNGTPGQCNQDTSSPLERMTLPSMCTLEPLQEDLFVGYHHGPQLPRLKDILPIFSFTAGSGEETILPSLPSPEHGEEAQIARVRRDIDPKRLSIRGHREGFTSFGERATVDMPGASLRHFNITKRRRNDEDREDGLLRRKAWREDEKSGSTIISKFVKHPELAINLARFLPVQDLINLYSVSRDFYYIVNHRFTTVVMAQAHQRAPESAKTFPFRCYASLCQEDPAERPHPVPQKAATGQARTVPTFRWLKMICFREMVVHQIVVIMAEDGVPVPKECIPAIKKMWLMMDMPDNLRRIGFIQNEKVFTDQDLFFLTMFFIKLDMRFTDPLTGSGTDGMRTMLLSQPSLSYLWRALKRTILISKLEVIRMYVRWKHMPDESERGQPMFGVAPEEIGMTQYEAWGKGKSRIPLQRPDELVMKESIRRGLKLHKKYTDMMLWGYVSMQTFEDIEPQVLERPLARLEGLEKDLVPPEDRKKVIPPKQVSFRVVQGRGQARA